MVPMQVLEYVKKLSRMDHAVFLYESLEIKHQVLFSFLNNGLEKGMGCIYVAGEETPEQIRKTMKDFGIDVEKYELEGSLRVLNYDPLYVRRGVFNSIPEIMENWSKEIQHFVLHGIKDVRIASEAAFKMVEHASIQDILDYETSLGRTLKIPITAICAYNTEQTMRGRPQFFADILKAHGHGIFQGAAFKLGY
jgi:hypothetical protein